MGATGAFGRFASRALDLALPARCAGCGDEGPPLCAACAPALDGRLDLPGGVPLGLPSDIPAPLLQLEWCASYSDTIRRAIRDLKYGGERRLADMFGAAIARRWRRVGAGGDVVVPVPIHADRARDRGYDQAILIAVVAARGLGLPFAPILERTRHTAVQFELDRGARAGNVRGAFRVVLPPSEALARATVARGAARATVGGGPLAGRWVVLVDDIVTTGSTLVACAEPLLAAGAVGVSAVAVARER